MRTGEHITLQEAAEALGISEQTARRWVKFGKLKAYKPGLRYLIPTSAVDALLENDSPKGSASPDSSHVGRRFDQYTDAELSDIRKQALTELVERTKDGAATRGAGVPSPADVLIQLLDDITSDANRRMNGSRFTVTDAQSVLNQIVGLNNVFSIFENDITAWLSDTSALDAIDEKTANTIMRIDDFLEEQEASAAVHPNGAAVTDIESVRRARESSAVAKEGIRKHA